ISIPHYCYHPKLSIAGNCRMCLVEVEKIPKLQIACNTLVQEGMVVKTQSPQVLAARRGVLEFLLINHPLDCPICDQAGECWLQNYYMDYSLEASRFSERKEPERKRQPFGPNVVFDAERCIKCTRCVRFLDEVTQTHELTVLNRSDDSTIALFPGKTLDNPLAANVNDICPVGALTDRDFRFRARVWYLKSTPSICPGCSTGCNIHIETYENRIARFKPRINDSVNGHWICDEGRYCFHGLTGGERLTSPLIRQEGGKLVPADWDSAVQAALIGLRDTEGLAGLLSARSTNEEAFLFARLMRAFSPKATVEVSYQARDLTTVEKILKSPDRSPNYRGAREMGAGTEPGWESWRDKLLDGDLRALYLAGEDLLSLFPDPERILRAIRGLSFLVVQDTTLSPTAELAHVVFPATHFAEKEGTYTNRRGRVQRVCCACVAPAGALPDHAIFGRLLAALGHPQAGSNPADVFRQITAEIPRYRDLTYESIGGAGVELEGI
ncbi:MAG TPA: molybdopterin-dependent oxidoreductase, partial [Candidatus Binatia bacterium]